MSYDDVVAASQTARARPTIPTPGAAEAASAEQRRRARLTIANHATDPQDCAELLEMLGLLDEQEGAAHP